MKYHLTAYYSREQLTQATKQTSFTRQTTKWIKLTTDHKEFPPVLNMRPQRGTAETQQHNLNNGTRRMSRLRPVPSPRRFYQSGNNSTSTGYGAMENRKSCCGCDGRCKQTDASLKTDKYMAAVVCNYQYNSHIIIMLFASLWYLHSLHRIKYKAQMY
jgi:hypothetical protein